jgi:hypothetical protein
MDALSSTRKMVSKALRKAYGSSAEVILGSERALEYDGAGDGARPGTGALWIVMVGFAAADEGSTGPIAEYGGGGGSSGPGLKDCGAELNGLLEFGVGFGLGERERDFLDSLSFNDPKSERLGDDGVGVMVGLMS